MKKTLLLVFLIISYHCFPQFSKTHYIPPISGTIEQPIQLQHIYISSPSTTPVNFQITPIGGTPINGTVSRNAPYVYNAGVGQNTPFHVHEQQVSTVLSDKGYIIEAEDQIYAAVRTTATPENYQAGVIVSKGLAGLGTTFRIGAFTNTGIAAYRTFHYTFISVLATENNTTVSFSDIKPGVQIINDFPAGNTPAPVLLNRGQSYVIAVQGSNAANRDGLIGALVSSDKPIAVNCGSFAGTNGNIDNNLDLGFDQIVPFERTGNEYIFIKGLGENVVEKALIVAHQDNTEVYLNGSSAPIAILSAGQYYTVDGFSFNENGNLYVRTSKNVFCYQGIGGEGSQANQELFFVPPLSCETPKIIDNIPLIEQIGNVVFSGNINITTKTGAQLNFIINGNNYALANLPFGVLVNGPHEVTGNANYETYTIKGLTGNISVFSDKELYLSYVSSNGNASYGGYYSGFTFKPEVAFTKQHNNLPTCIPNIKLTTNSLSAFDSYQWYFNNLPIPGATQSSYTPTQPGYYHLSATISNCVSNLISDTIPVSDCTKDTDNDGINDNVDLDNDGDGIANCSESHGNLDINLSNPYIGNVVLNDYSNSFTASIATNGAGTHPVTPVTSNSNTNIVIETATGKENSVKYELTFAQPLSVSLEYVSNAANSDLLNTNAEYIVSVPTHKTVTIKNPSNQLLVDTNYDGIYESGVTEFSSFEIRFRLNSSTALAAGTGTFSFVSNLTPGIAFKVINLSDTQPGKATFKLVATCIPRDFDGDGIPDQWDLDSDNDGIPDTIEAQGSNVIPATSTDTNKDGISDAYGAGLTPIDTDNDGIPDFLDSDSDNDGIYDIVESGNSHLDADANGLIDGTNFGSNGLHNTLETAPDNGILNYTITDSNNDGIANYIALDSDGDGCYDAREAGFADPDNDGILGMGTPTVSPNGVVMNNIGYQTPNPAYLQYAIIEITPIPDTVFRFCDDNHDGLYSFNTAAIESHLVNNQPLTNYTFTYWDANNNPLPSPLPNPWEAPTQLITVRIANAIANATNAPCDVETTIQFTVDILPEVFPVTIAPQCDDETDPLQADGKVNFDTTGIEQSLLGNQSGMTLSYYDSNNQFLFHQLPNPFFSATQNIKVVVENPANINCNAETTLQFTVNALPQINVNANGAANEIICTDDPTARIIIHAGVLQSAYIPWYTYQWYHNNTAIPSANYFQITIDQAGTYTVEVTNALGCTVTRTIEIAPSNIAIIDDVEIVDITDNNTVTILVSGDGDYVYSIEGAEGSYQANNVFENLMGGIYTVAVKDKNGCGIATQTIAVISAPKFFTPNGDGYNDTWLVKGVNENFNYKSAIYIFDRYGKLLKQLGTTGQGWDGTFNGKPMPSDDYWYTIEFEDGRSTKGHFALKR
jgi:gliding motility-associated-like protein